MVTGFRLPRPLPTITHTGRQDTTERPMFDTDLGDNQGQDPGQTRRAQAVLRQERPHGQHLDL